MTYLLNMYLQNFRVQSPLFLITYPENNVFGVTNGTGIPQKAIAEGYWVLLDGLKAGEYTIEFTGGVSAFDFETHVTYHITIEPKHNNNNNNNNNYYDNNEYKSYSNEYDKNYNNNYYDDNRNDSREDKKMKSPTTTTSMMIVMDMNTLIIMANMEMNMHLMKKNK